MEWKHMVKPLIGITMHAVREPFLRSAVNQQYVEAVLGAGGTPLCIPLGMDPESIDRLYGMIDGLLLPGGDDVHPSRYGHDPHPQLGDVDEVRDELEISCAIRALGEDLPVLGICRGNQVLAVAAGGTLHQDIPSEWASDLLHDVRQHGRHHLSHAITVEPNTRLHFMIGATDSRVNSFHHQAVRDVPQGFIVSARSPDGIVEAIESPVHHFAVGIQCHPEAIWHTTAPHFKGVFDHFVEAAAEYAATRDTLISLRA